MKNEIYEHQNTDSEIDEKDLYDIDKLSLDDNDKYDVSVRLKENSIIYMTWRSSIIWILYMIMK